jgi:hypothetical protein
MAIERFIEIPWSAFIPRRIEKLVWESELVTHD